MGRVNTRKPRRKTAKRSARASAPPATAASPATPVRPHTAPVAGTGGGDIVSPWGRVDEEYALIKADLKRLAWVTGLLFLLLMVLTYFLR